ncbi:MAG: PKD domain-containing protein, partial [Flavobacteriales bacterium]
MNKLLFLVITCFSFFGFSQDAASYKFIENKGQWHKNVKFKTDIEGGALFLEKNKLTYNFHDEEELQSYFHQHNPEAAKRDLKRLNLHSYQVEFLGGNTVELKTLNKTKEYYNYFVGSDKSKWTSNVYGYSAVQYNELYPAIDFVFYNSKEGFLKYDFKIKPKGDPLAIKLNYKGVSSIKLKQGSLIISTSVNKVKEEKPYAYQYSNGFRKEVPCNYTLLNGVVGFEFPKGYDQSKELIIDPTLIFSTYSGSTSNNFGYTATFDGDGFLYSGSTVFGVTGSYPTTIGAYSTSFNGGIVDVAISKYDTTGTFLVYSTYVGGTSDELPHSMIANSNDELFVYGTTSSLDFPFSKGCYDSIFNGGTAIAPVGLGVNFINGSDIFVIRLSSAGDSLLSGTYVGGAANDGLNSSVSNDLKYNYADEVRGEIEIDKNDNIYVVSCTRSTNFPVTAGVFQASHGGSTLDGCIFKMDNKLSTLIWSSYLGGIGDDAAYSIAIDRQDNAYVAGGTNSPDFIKTVNAIDTSFTGLRADGFVTKINATGSAVLNSTFYGSDLYDQIYFVEVDRKDSVYVFGQTDKMDSTFIKNAGYYTFNSGQFITKMSPNLDFVEWSTVFGSGGGGPNISPTAFLVDVCNKIYLSGWGGTTNIASTNNAISTTGMDTTAGAYQTTTDGSDFYLMVLESDASNIFYGSFYGGASSAEHVDGGTSRFDRNGRIFQSVCAGCGGFDDFPIAPNPGAFSTTNGSSCNNGVFKFDFNLPITLADFDVNSVTCINDTSFFRNRSLNGTSFHWNFGDGNFSTQYSPFHVYRNPGNYIVTLTVTDTSACNFSDTLRKQITILGDSLWFLPNDTICDSSFKQIGFLPSSNPTITYSWSPSQGLSDTTISNPVASPLNTTTYRLLISNGVCIDTVFTTIFVSKLRLIVPSDTLLCIPGNPITILANSLGTTNSFQWSSNPLFTDRLNSSSGDSSLTVAPSVSTTYYIRIGNNGCFLLDTVRINIFSSQVSISGPDGICLGDT